MYAPECQALTGSLIRKGGNPQFRGCVVVDGGRASCLLFPRAARVQDRTGDRVAERLTVDAFPSKARADLSGPGSELGGAR